METLLLRIRASEWYGRVQLSLIFVTEGVMSLRSGVFWTLSYVLLLALMYLFHSPFRLQVETRTDWYAQVTKGLQVWLAVVLIGFHVGPHVVESRSRASAAMVSKYSTPSEAPDIFVEDTAATIFFPTFCFNTAFCLFLHKIKRRYKLDFTYGSSFTVVIINSVLLSSFATMHYTMCSEVFSTGEATVGACQGAWEASSINAPAPLSAWTGTSRIICPQPVTERPFACIAFLCFLCVLFMVVDYLYKKHVADGDPWRGILWADLYPEKAARSDSRMTAASHASSISRRWGRLRTLLKKKALADHLGVAEGDPRLQEALPRTISLPVREAETNRVLHDDSSPAGWQDEHGQLALASGQYVSHPTNRPGMVPWFSTFIMATTWQALARMSLEFLTFDVRVLQHYVTPKLFELHFQSSLKRLPSLSAGDEDHRLSTNDKLGTRDTSSPCDDTLKSAQLPPTATQPARQQSSREPQEDCVKDNDASVWFDWIADVGDGFNPTYAMARLLAKPLLTLPLRRSSGKTGGLAMLSKPNNSKSPGSVGDGSASRALPNLETGGFVTLPRGSFVLVGGDLAYPSPNDETYTMRLFEPYHDAMSGNTRLQTEFHAQQNRVLVADVSDVDIAHVHLLDAATVSAMATGRAALCTGCATVEEALRSVPLLFAIPGNHDWFDGLTTYRKYIIERMWIGGWLMPQRSSFFVLRLPCNWFILCCDTGNIQDIDVAQRNYFLGVIEKHMDVESCVILAAHEPGWVYDAMLQTSKLTQPELSRVAAALGTRLRLRLAGDIHHYSRHVPAEAASEAATLVVSGGGGAFLHGARDDVIISQRTRYRRACAFPDRDTFVSMASRLWGFRVINWKFDLIIGVCGFLVVVSLLPQTIEGGRHRSESGPLMTLPDAVEAWWEQVCVYVVTLFTKGIASVLASLGFFAVFAVAGSEKNISVWLRLLHSFFWSFLTVFTCCGMLAYLICTLQYMVENKLLVSADGHWGSVVEDRVRASVDGLLNHTQRILRGADAIVAADELRLLQTSFYGGSLVSWCGVLLRCLDPFEMLAYLSEKVSSSKMGTFSEDASRLDEALYYLYFVFFYWILVTPLVSFLIGSYLVCSVTLFDCLFDPAYSAFQIEEYKHFLRFRLVTATRELHTYVVAMRQVPKSWNKDSAHQEEVKNGALKAAPPHLRAHPSRWQGRHRAFTRRDDGGHLVSEEGVEEGVEVLEHFVCAPHQPPTATSVRRRDTE